MTDGIRSGPANPSRLLIVLHGVGDSAEGIAPIGEYCANRLPGTAAIALDGPEPWDGSSLGRQWFSLTGITPQNRIDRVMAALPALWARIEAILEAEGVSASQLVLMGFSQGAIMTLASVATGRRFLAGLALAGRLGSAPVPATAASPRLFIAHGDMDPVIPVAEGLDAAEQLRSAGYAVSVMRRPLLGHGVDAEELDAMVQFLRQL